MPKLDYTRCQRLLTAPRASSALRADHRIAKDCKIAIMAPCAARSRPSRFSPAAARRIAVLAAAGVLRRRGCQQRFRAGVDLVHFSRDRHRQEGAPITGLTADDFEIVEEGKPQTISLFRRRRSRPGQARLPPLHLGLLLDTAAAWSEDISDVRTAVDQVPQHASSDAVDITLVDFDTEVRVARYGQNEYRAADRAHPRRKTDGWTALYDAIGVYLDGAGASGRPEDPAALHRRRRHAQRADVRASCSICCKASDVTVYAIGLPRASVVVGADGAAACELQRIAAMTGGQAFFPTSVKELDEDLREDRSARSRARYSLGYLSTDTRKDGAWRKVEIKLQAARPRRAPSSAPATAISRPIEAGGH